MMTAKTFQSQENKEYRQGIHAYRSAGVSFNRNRMPGCQVELRTTFAIFRILRFTEHHFIY
jgi:hypothetical protein